MGLSTGVGMLKVKIWYGLDPGTGRWGCPMRQRWGLGPHQEMSPALEDKLAFTVTETDSYEEAATLAQKWNCAVDDSTLHALTRGGWGGEPSVKSKSGWRVWRGN